MPHEHIAANAEGTGFDIPFERFAQHPLMGAWLFYTLHPKLLDRIDQEVGLYKINPGLYELERITSECIGDHSADVGYWKQIKLRYLHLWDRPRSAASILSIVPPAWKDSSGWKEIWDRKETLLEEAEMKLSKVHLDARGYCGWLMTNPLFLAEHDDFFRKWHHHVLQYGLPQPGPLPEEILDVAAPDDPEKKLLDQVVDLDPQTHQYCLEFQSFLNRWHLANLQSPYLPEPMLPHYPELLPKRAQFRLRGGGGIVYIPDTAPLPDRKSLRQMIENSLSRTRSQEHLREWSEIVSAGNHAKHEIPRFARVFQLQHFWISLHRRWGQHLQGKIEKLQYAFGHFLLPNDGLNGTRSVESIRKDLHFISARRGGPDWYLKPNALDDF